MNCADRINRGQYSDAVLNELESQNDGQVEGIMGKVRQLKDVSTPFYTLSLYPYPFYGPIREHQGPLY